MNTYSIQWICEIFTQKFQFSGDCYDRILEMPTFGGSQNHAGLQIADNIASGMVVPMAGRAYCTDHVKGSHVNSHYDRISDWLGQKLRHRQFRYEDDGKWGGGIVVSDPVGGKHSGHLFRKPNLPELVAAGDQAGRSRPSQPL